MISITSSLLLPHSFRITARFSWRRPLAKVETVFVVEWAWATTRLNKPFWLNEFCIQKVDAFAGPTQTPDEPWVWWENLEQFPLHSVGLVFVLVKLSQNKNLWLTSRVEASCQWVRKFKILCFGLIFQWTKFQAIKHLLTHVWTDELSFGSCRFWWAHNNNVIKSSKPKSQHINGRFDIAIKSEQKRKTKKIDTSCLHLTKSHVVSFAVVYYCTHKRWR